MKRTFILGWVLCLMNASLLYSQQDASLDTVSIAVSDSGEGKTSIYTVSFSISEDLSAIAMMVVTFPPEFDLSGILLAGSNTINGGFAIQVDANTLRLTRKGQGHILARNQPLEISFGNVKNPAAGNYSVLVSLWQAVSSAESSNSRAVLVPILSPDS